MSSSGSIFTMRILGSKYSASNAIYFSPHDMLHQKLHDSSGLFIQLERWLAFIKARTESAVNVYNE